MRAISRRRENCCLRILFFGDRLVPRCEDGKHFRKGQYCALRSQRIIGVKFWIVSRRAIFKAFAKMRFSGDHVGSFRGYAPTGKAAAMARRSTFPSSRASNRRTMGSWRSYFTRGGSKEKCQPIRPWAMTKTATGTNRQPRQHIVFKALRGAKP